MAAGTIEVINTGHGAKLRISELVERFGENVVITNAYPLLDTEGDGMGFAVEVETEAA